MRSHPPPATAQHKSAPSIQHVGRTSPSRSRGLPRIPLVPRKAALGNQTFVFGRFQQIPVLLRPRGIQLEQLRECSRVPSGRPPRHYVHIVGASAWNPTSGSSGSAGDSSTAFRLVTEQGTHLYCAAPTSTCRDLWLGALHAGLDRSLLESGIPKQQPLQPPPPAKTGRLRPRIKKHCFSCGAIDDADKSPIRVKCVPVPHYAKETRCDLCQNCLIAQGLLNHVCFLRELFASAHHERKALMMAKQLCWNAMKEANPALEREVMEEVAALAGLSSNDSTATSGGKTTTTGETTQEGGSSSSSNGSKESWSSCAEVRFERPLRKKSHGDQ